MRLVLPEGAKRTFLDVAKGDLLPEWIRVNVALRIDVGNPNTGGVGSSSIPGKARSDPLRLSFMPFGQEGQEDENPVDGVFIRQDFPGPSPLDQFAGFSKDRVDGLAHLGRGEIVLDQMPAPAGVGQMVKADPVDPIPFRHFKNSRKRLDVPAGQGKA
jgi:hypothetical protein